MSFLIFSLRGLALGATALTFVSPASAQPVVAVPVVAQPVVVQPVVVQPVVVAPAPEQIVIVGSYRRLPDNVDSASSIVSYADLDLSFPADRDILRHRISLTARYLCDKLGESDTGCAVSERSGSISRRAAPPGYAHRPGSRHIRKRGLRCTRRARFGRLAEWEADVGILRS
jgi:UrcA family protein